MTTRVTLRSLSDGQVIVQKQSLAEDKIDHRHESEWLALARHRGVGQLVGVSEEPYTIKTAHAGTTTLRTARPDPKSAARLLAATANTLADLHERNLVHGNLTLDHVIVSGENRTTLCSPDGVINDPTTDLRALGEMVTEILERWRAENGAPETESQWLSLAERLKSKESNLTARRAHLAFGRLGPDPRIVAKGHPGLSLARFSVLRAKLSARSLRTGVAAIAVVGALLIGLTILRSQESDKASGSGVDLVVGGNLYQVGQSGDIAMAVPSRCEGQPEAVLLDTNSVVWLFSQATDQQTAVALAQIPGATNLVADSDGKCGRIWVTGPAGQTLVVGGD